MDSILSIALLLTAFAGAVMALLPHISPRQYFFGITVAPELRSTRAARASIRRYQSWVLAAVLVSALAIVFLGASLPSLIMVLAPMLPGVAGVMAFLRERARVAQHARKAAPAPEYGVGGPQHIPHWMWLALPPFLLPLATAFWLQAHWSRIPERFPVHWDAAGQVDRWATKTPQNVYSPLLFGCGLLLLILLTSLAVFYGSRRGPQRLIVLKIVVAAMYLMAVMFTMVALLPIQPMRPILLFIPLVAFILVVSIFVIRAIRDPNMPADATPDERWHLGAIYYNPEDSAIFVQKRIGIGYTFNFANPLAWLLLGSLIGGLVGLSLLLPK